MAARLGREWNQLVGHDVREFGIVKGWDDMSLAGIRQKWMF